MTLKNLLLASILIYPAAALYAQRGPANPKMTALMGQKDSTALNRQLDSLLHTNREEDLSLLSSYYNAKQNAAKRDEIAKLSLQKFPNGKAAFNEIGERIYNERDPEQNEKNYKELVSRFGGREGFNLDGSRYFVAVTFLGKNKPEKVSTYLNMIENPTYKTNAFSYAAREAIAANDYKIGETLIRKTFSDLKGDTSSQGMDEYRRIFSELLYANGKYEEGYPYAKMVFDKQSKVTSVGVGRLNNTYLNYLLKLKKYKDAYPLMETEIRSGNGTAELKDNFKTAYMAAKGSADGYDALMANINESLNEKIDAELAKKMKSEPAFDFTTKDLSGKTVKLSDFKGKVVILDFWATWCGPCKASFPMMQKAVNQYKNDKDVVFLFIHTMETSPDAAKFAGDYIKDQKYTFNVLMDMKDPKTNSNPAANGYKVRGIPSKFVIDRAGNIRFSTLGGGTSGEDGFLREMAAMIQLAKSSASLGK